jgi:hypothetical protein
MCAYPKNPKKGEMWTDPCTFNEYIFDGKDWNGYWGVLSVGGGSCGFTTGDDLFKNLICEDY